eukprot:689456-Pelagomonas_calceolata.AAC.1
MQGCAFAIREQECVKIPEGWGLGGSEKFSVIGSPKMAKLSFSRCFQNSPPSYVCPHRKEKRRRSMPAKRLLALRKGSRASKGFGKGPLNFDTDAGHS